MRCKGQNPCSSMWIVCRFSVVDDLNCLGWKRIDRGHAGPPLGSRLLHWSARMWSCQCHVVLMAATLHTVWELASLCLLTLFYFLLNDLKLWNNNFLWNKPMLSSWLFISHCQVHNFMTEADIPPPNQRTSVTRGTALIYLRDGMLEWHSVSEGSEIWNIFPEGLSPIRMFEVSKLFPIYLPSGGDSDQNYHKDRLKSYTNAHLEL